LITRRIKRFRRNRKLSAALKIVGPAANAAGVSVEEAATLLSRCAGIDTEALVVNMHQAMKKLAQNHGEKTMNDTEKQMVSIAEVQAAYKTAVLKTEDKFYRPTLEAFLTELTKPPEPRLRDDCPVTVDGSDGGSHVMYANRLSRHNTNIRPLIPADKVMEWAEEMEDQQVEFGEVDCQDFLAAKIAAYTTEPSNE